MNIHILSRYCPAENRSGPFTYLLDVMRALNQRGYILELVVLDQWFQAENIPQSVKDIVHVVILPSQSEVTEKTIHKRYTVKDVLWLVYNFLPDQIIHPLRRALYAVKGKPLPGTHEHDALATQQEIEFIERRIHEFQPNVIIANHTCLGNIFKLVDNNPFILKVILTHHIEHQRSDVFSQQAFRSRDSQWTREKEAELLQYADVLLAIQRDDAHVLQQMSPQSDVIYAPMSAALHEHPSAQQISGRCLFIGSDIEHNVYGLQWFLEQAWESVLQSVPHASLHVCGTVCSKIRQTYLNVRLLGRVDSTDLEYAAAEVCIIPLLVGSGLKIKLVEALSHERACVATSVGVQGVQELRDKAVLVADTPQDFARAVISVLTDAETRRTMEEEARRYVMEKLSPEKVYQPFVNRIYEHIAQQQQQKEKI